MSLASLLIKRNSTLLLAAALASGLFLAGCDEHVDVVRDHSVAIRKHATWAWRPAPPPETPGKNVALEMINAIPASITKRSAWPSAPTSSKPCDPKASIRLTIPLPPNSWSIITWAFAAAP
jgi:hypothetical protein